MLIWCEESIRMLKTAKKILWTAKLQNSIGIRKDQIYAEVSGNGLNQCIGNLQHDAPRFPANHIHPDVVVSRFKAGIRNDAGDDLI